MINPSKRAKSFEDLLYDVYGFVSTDEELNFDINRNCYTNFYTHLAYKAWCASRYGYTPISAPIKEFKQ